MDIEKVDGHTQLKPGDKVTYDKGGMNERGIVKSYLAYTDRKLFVVYSCSNDWDNYQNYTGQLTDISMLSPGWH